MPMTLPLRLTFFSDGIDSIWTAEDAQAATEAFANAEVPVRRCEAVNSTDQVKQILRIVGEMSKSLVAGLTLWWTSKWTHKEKRVNKDSDSDSDDDSSKKPDPVHSKALRKAGFTDAEMKALYGRWGSLASLLPVSFLLSFKLK